MGYKNKKRGPAVSLAWLESYLAVYTHRDYSRAAAQCGRTHDVVRDHVEKLETWLGLPLIGQGAPPLDVFEENAHRVAEVADNVLRRFDQAFADIHKAVPAVDLNEIQSRRAEVTLLQLELMVELQKHKGVEIAAHAVHCDVSTARRQVKQLETMIDCKLVDGRALKNRTESGRVVAEAAEEIVSSLRHIRIVPTRACQKFARRQKRQRQLFVQLVKARKNIRAAVSWKRVTAIKRKQLQALRARRLSLQKRYDMFNRLIGPLPKEELAELLLSTLKKGLPKGASLDNVLKEVVRRYEEAIANPGAGSDD